MTNKQFRKSVSKVSRAVMNWHGLRYQDIEINSRLSTVSVGGLFFTQGDSATELINEAEKTANKTGLSEKTCLIWYLDNAGVLIAGYNQ